MKLKNIVLPIISVVVIGCQEYVPVQTFTEPDDPIALSPEADAAWDKVNNKLNGGWGTIDFRFSRSEVPHILENNKYSISAWRGEKASAQIVLWTAKGADGVECEIRDFKSKDTVLPSSIAQARFVRYTISEHSPFDSLESGSTILSGDMLDSLSRFDMSAKTTRPVWITINVPQNAAPGIYNSEVTVKHNGWGKISLPLELKVQDHTLPTPDQWKYHLDLWQHPSAVARAQGLKMWSDEHFEALEGLMSMLAKAGQKVVTANLNKDPWNHQCFDAYEDMIKWTLRKDGTWSYDYKVFDRWVSMMMSLGINKMINCYSMAPWNDELDYIDEATGKKVTIVAKPGKPEFTRMWEPFLLDFKKHLDSKGWLNITNIAMDERSPEIMDEAVKVLEKCAPEMGFAIADNHQSYKKYAKMRDVCVIQGQHADHQDILDRRVNGYNTTFYVCCAPLYPNTFTFSNPYEAELLGWYGLAFDYDGMLRWAYNSWPKDPLTDSRYGVWSSGDTYLVYPFMRSSIRFERLIDGIESAEKVRILRMEGVNLDQLEKELEVFRNRNINDNKIPWDEMVNKANRILEIL